MSTAKNFNQVTLIGHLGGEVTKVPVGETSVARFSLATTERFSSKGSVEKKEVTEWHEVDAWGSIGEIAAKYLHKGSWVMIVGRLKYDHWEKEGVKMKTAKIVADDLILLDSVKESEKGEV